MRATAAARLEERAAHLDYVAGYQSLIIFAGPLLAEERMIGSLFVFDVPDRAALDRYLARDPYFTRPIFETVEIYESRWMVPEREPGFPRRGGGARTDRLIALRPRGPCP